MCLWNLPYRINSADTSTEAGEQRGTRELGVSLSNPYSLAFSLQDLRTENLKA